MKRSPMPPRKPMKRKRSPKLDAFAAELDAVTPALIARSGGECEVQVPGICLGKATNRHHRIKRGNASCTNDLDNLIHLCGSGTTGCHGWVHANKQGDVYEHGWLLRSWDDPAKVPWTKFRRSSLL